MDCTKCETGEMRVGSTDVGSDYVQIILVCNECGAQQVADLFEDDFVDLDKDEEVEVD